MTGFAPNVVENRWSPFFNRGSVRRIARTSSVSGTTGAASLFIRSARMTAQLLVEVELAPSRLGHLAFALTGEGEHWKSGP